MLGMIAWHIFYLPCLSCLVRWLGVHVLLASLAGLLVLACLSWRTCSYWLACVLAWLAWLRVACSLDLAWLPGLLGLLGLLDLLGLLGLLGVLGVLGLLA